MSLPSALRFTTLLVGLTTGSQPIAVEAPTETASMELRLDRHTVAVDSQAPWDFRVDLGMALRPHRIEAIARDAQGRELGRVQQGINQPAVEEARWDSDGRPLTPLIFEVGDATRWTEAEDWRGLLTRGGTALEPEEVTSGSVQFLLVVDRGAAGELRRLGRELTQRVNPATASYLYGLGGPATTVPRGFGILGLPGSMPPVGMVAAGMRPGDTVEAVDTVPYSRGLEFYRSRPGELPTIGGLVWATTQIRQPPMEGGQSLADAVAVAVAAQLDPSRPTAVLLVAGPQPEDSSRFPAPEVRRFVEDAGALLAVWRIERERQNLVHGESRFQKRRAAKLSRRYSAVGLEPPNREEWLTALEDGWGEYTSIGSLDDLLAAAHALRERVARQRVIWVAGAESEGEIEVGRRAEGVRRLGG